MNIISFIGFIGQEVFVNLIAGGFLRLLKGDVIFFRGWRRRKERVEPALLYQHHREHVSQENFWQAFKTNEDLLLLTIKSLHTRNRIREMIENGEATIRSLRILTLNPDAPEAIFEALAKHINEPTANCIKDCQEAYIEFSDLASKYTFVEVRRYDSLPTMQGIIVSGKYAFVELLTYQSAPGERTALMILHAESPTSLTLFTQRVERLWRDSKP